MALVDRAKNILFQPRTEWPVIAAEPASVNGLFTGYAVILALLPVVGTILGGFVLSRYLGSTYLVASALINYAVGLLILFLMTVLADALAPSFDGRKDRIAATKLLVYSATPIWIAGLFAFIPGLNIVVGLIGFAYCAYLLYLGAPVVSGVPEAKSAGYTVVVIVIWIVLGLVVAGALVGAATASLITAGAGVPAYNY